MSKYDMNAWARRSVANVSMPCDLKDLLPKIAEAEGKSVAALVRTALYDSYHQKYPDLEKIVTRVGSSKFFHGQ